MTTAVEQEQVTDINTMADLVTGLRQLGYRAKLTDDGVLTGTSLAEDDGSSRDFVMLITEEGNSLQFNCHLTTIGELAIKDENELSAILLALMAANAEIQPWAVALINPDGELDDSDTLVLTDSMPMGDLSIGELESAMDSFGRALAQVVPNYIS